MIGDLTFNANGRGAETMDGMKREFCGCGLKVFSKGKCRACYDKGYKIQNGIGLKASRGYAESAAQALPILCRAFECTAVDLARFIMESPGGGTPYSPTMGKGRSASHSRHRAAMQDRAITNYEL